MEGEEFDQGNAYGSGETEKISASRASASASAGGAGHRYPTVAVLCAGSAVELCWAQDHVDAIIDAWYPGSQGWAGPGGAAVWRVQPGGQTARHAFTGIPQTCLIFWIIPWKAAPTAISRAKLCIPFGYGAFYTSFAYSDLKLNKEEAFRWGIPLCGGYRPVRGAQDGDEVPGMLSPG